MVKRGEVWLVALDPTIGREIRKTRPAVVMSPDELNASLDTVIVAPMTTGASYAPYRVDVSLSNVRGLILIDQLRTIDRQRLVRRIARLPGKALGLALRVAQEMFAE